MRPRLIATLAALFLGVTIYAGLILATVAVKPPRRAVGNAPADAEAVAIAGADGARLRAWYFRSPSSRGEAVILLHGVADSRLGVQGHARLLLRHGYDALTPDARAHGESGGDFATYGVQDADDVRRWAAWLIESRGARRLYGLGESMGASLLIQALPLEPRIAALVAESPFASFREIAYDRMGQPFGVGDWLGRTLFRPFVEAGLLAARFRDGVPLEDASPERALALTQTPVLLIHPVTDHNIPVRHSRRLKRMHPRLELWEVAQAHHTGTISAQPQEFERRVIGWFRKQRRE